jgi:hypothetical protein
LFSRIGVHSLLEREEDVDALLAGSAEIGLYIRRIGLFETIELSNHFLHGPILPPGANHDQTDKRLSAAADRAKSAFGAGGCCNLPAAAL